MKTMTAVLVATAFLISGCVQYTYFGRIAAKDSADKDREAVAYWTKTERMFWFDTASGGVRVRTECSANTLDYEEKPQGSVFLRQPTDVPVERGIAIGAPCGTVLNAKRVNDLDVGPLDLTVHCRPDTSNEFAVSAVVNYLQARETPYRFHIEKKRTADISDGAPKTRPCRE